MPGPGRSLRRAGSRSIGTAPLFLLMGGRAAGPARGRRLRRGPRRSWARRRGPQRRVRGVHPGRQARRPGRLGSVRSHPGPRVPGLPACTVTPGPSSQGPPSPRTRTTSQDTPRITGRKTAAAASRTAPGRHPRRNGSEMLADRRRQPHNALPLKPSDPGQRLARGSDSPARDNK